MAVIFEDPKHTEWNVWDYRLFKAFYILEDWYRDGIPLWIDESERVSFNAKARISRSRAAIDRAQDASTANGKKAVPGRYFIAEPVVIDGGDMPTLAEWVEEQQRKDGVSSPVTKFGGGPGRKNNIVQGKK